MFGHLDCLLCGQYSDNIVFITFSSHSYCGHKLSEFITVDNIILTLIFHYWNVLKTFVSHSGLVRDHGRRITASISWGKDKKWSFQERRNSEEIYNQRFINGLFPFHIFPSSGGEIFPLLITGWQTLAMEKNKIKPRYYWYGTKIETKVFVWKKPLENKKQRRKEKLLQKFLTQITSISPSLLLCPLPPGPVPPPPGLRSCCRCRCCRLDFSESYRSAIFDMLEEKFQRKTSFFASILGARGG